MDVTCTVYGSNDFEKTPDYLLVQPILSGIPACVEGLKMFIGKIVPQLH